MDCAVPMSSLLGVPAVKMLWWYVETGRTAPGRRTEQRDMSLFSDPSNDERILAAAKVIALVAAVALVAFVAGRLTAPGPSVDPVAVDAYVEEAREVCGMSSGEWDEAYWAEVGLLGSEDHNRGRKVTVSVVNRQTGHPIVSLNYSGVPVYDVWEPDRVISDTPSSDQKHACFDSDGDGKVTDQDSWEPIEPG